MRANSGPPACRFLTVLRSRRPIRSSVPSLATRASARRTLWSTAPCTTPTAADFPPVCRCFRKSSMHCQKNNLSASRLSPPTGTGRLFCCKKEGPPWEVPLFVSSAYSSVLSSGSGARKMMSSRLAASPSASTADLPTMVPPAFSVSISSACSDSPVLMTSSTSSTRLPFK